MRVKVPSEYISEFPEELKSMIFKQSVLNKRRWREHLKNVKHD